MAGHVRRVCEVAYFHIHSIAKIRNYLITVTCKTMHSLGLVMLRVDCSNTLLYGVSETLLHKLQMDQNSAARFITGAGRRDHITPVLFSLHSLPFRQRIKLFKILLLVYRAVHQLRPEYLTSLVTPCSPSHSLRSAVNVN